MLLVLGFDVRLIYLDGVKYLFLKILHKIK